MLNHHSVYHDEPHTGSDTATPGDEGPQADSAQDESTQGPTSALPSTEELYRWIYGPGPGYISTLALLRGEDGKVDEQETAQQFFAYPSSLGSLAKALQRESPGRDRYLGAHKISAKKRSKATALPLLALYADLDTAPIPKGEFRPSVVIEASRGRLQAFWFLDRPLDPDVVEPLNKRLTLAIGADKSGYDLTQLLRPPGTLNHKYDPPFEVRLLEYDGRAVDPDALDRLLPTVDVAQVRVNRICP